MIQVLQDWTQIGQAVRKLEYLGLPRHGSTEKCWDMALLCELVEPLARTVRVVDMGCSGLHTLRFLEQMGFQQLTGLDLQPTWLDRLKQIKRMVQRRQIKPPFRILKRDMLASGLPDGSCDVLTSISVIEHGVALDRFVGEAARLLRPGGLLFVTADYWAERIDCSDSSRQFGLPWQILCRADIEALLAQAAKHSLIPLQAGPLPECGQPCIVWQKKAYTFIALAFKKMSNRKDKP